MIKLKKNDLRNITLVLIGAAVVLFAFSYFMRQRDISNTPSKLFWAALDNSLSTTGYVRSMTSPQADGGKVSQQTLVRFAPELISAVEVRISSNDDQDIVTETVGLSNEDYLRYTSFPNGEGVEGKWTELPLAEGANGQIMVEAITQSLVLTANLKSSSRSDFVKSLKDGAVYEPVSAKKGVDLDGRKVTVVTVRINTEAFTSAQADLLKRIGLTHAADKLETGGNSGEVTAEFAIDPSSRQFVGAGVPEVKAQSSERFDSWNKVKDISKPEKQIEFSEIEKALTGGENASGN